MVVCNLIVPSNGILTMLSIESESRLAECFLRAAQDELEVEYLRQVLSARPTFHPEVLFERVNRCGTGYITLPDVMDQAYMCALQCSEAEAALVIRQYDGDLDGRLSYTEFCSLVLPSSKDILRTEALQRSIQPLTSDVIEVFTKLLHAEINCQRDLETARNGLSSRYDFNLLDAFRTVDTADWAYISVENLALFMQRRGIVFRSEQSEAAIRRVDVDNDGRVNYVEFVDFLLPCKGHSKQSFTSPTSTTSSLYPSSSPLRIPSRSTRNSTPLKSPLRSLSQTRSQSYSFARRSPEYQETDLEERINTDLELFRDLERYREDLMSAADFSPVAVFRVLDKRNRSEITVLDLWKAMEDMRIGVREEQVVQLVREYSTGKQGTLSFADVCRLISPYGLHPVERLNRGLHPLDAYRLSWETTEKLARVLQTALVLSHSSDSCVRSGSERLLDQISSRIRLTSHERAWLLERYGPPSLSHSQL